MESGGREDSGTFSDLIWIPKHVEDPVFVDQKLCYLQITMPAEILYATKARLYLGYLFVLSFISGPSRKEGVRVFIKRDY